jgi:hypothetical protein
MIEIIS